MAGTHLRVRGLGNACAVTARRTTLWVAWGHTTVDLPQSGSKHKDILEFTSSTFSFFMKAHERPDFESEGK